jgi:hypothetical protein
VPALYRLTQLLRWIPSHRLNDWALRVMRLHTEPDTIWRNIFELWRSNGEKLPFTVAKNSWSASAGHFLVVEEIQIKKWPYGSAWGRYYWKGIPSSHKEKIAAAGTYNWRLLSEGEHPPLGN